MSDEGYQLSQSLIALGSGGLFGMGLGQGRQKFAYLPYPESDFIFAIVGEDFGLIGCLTVIALFVLFVLAGLRVSLACRDRFGCLLGAGITSMIGLQAFINMGVVTGMLPTTGLPLPFFSAGGTSVSMMMAAVGILLSISRENGARIVETDGSTEWGKSMRYRKRKKAAAQVMVMTVAVVAVLAALLVLACSQVFRVRGILIVGNRNLSKEDVIALSGVQEGDNLFSISDAELKKNMERNRYIEYLGHEFDYRGTLSLHINERMGMGVVNAFGLYYVVDATGMVLECAGSAYPDTVAGPKINNLILDDNSRVTVGERLPVRDSGQLAAVQRVLAALDSTDMLGRVSLLDVKNLDNMYLMTTDGARIVLGDDAKLETKLLIAREVLVVREPLGTVKGAKIDVSSAREAHYIPNTLPTITPVPTATPTIAPSATPET